MQPSAVPSLRCLMSASVTCRHLHSAPPPITGVPAWTVSSLTTIRQPRRHGRGRATLALRISHTRARLIGISVANSRLDDPYQRGVGNLAASKRADLPKGWSRSLWIGGCAVTGTWAFAGRRSSFFLFLLSLSFGPLGIDTPAPHIGRTWLGTDEFFMHARVFAFSDACEAACGLPRPFLL
jgi:hypothetical protein